MSSLVNSPVVRYWRIAAVVDRKILIAGHSKFSESISKSYKLSQVANVLGSLIRSLLPVRFNILNDGMQLMTSIDCEVNWLSDTSRCSRYCKVLIETGNWLKTFEPTNSSLRFVNWLIWFGSDVSLLSLRLSVCNNHKSLRFVLPMHTNDSIEFLFKLNTSLRRTLQLMKTPAGIDFKLQSDKSKSGSGVSFAYWLDRKCAYLVWVVGCYGDS